MKSTCFSAIAAFALTVGASSLTHAAVIPVVEDVMTSSFFQGTDLVRGYPGDKRPTMRVSTNNPFGQGAPETIYMTFSPASFSGFSGSVPAAFLPSRGLRVDLAPTPPPPIRFKCLLLLCERRFDSVARLAGFTKTRPQARQGVGHGHCTLNGRRCDVVGVKRRQPLVELYAGLLTMFDQPAANWLTVNAETLEATVVRLPDEGDITLPVNVGFVVELMSR